MLFGISGYWIGFIASWISLAGALVAYIVLKTKTEKDDKLFKIAVDVKALVDVLLKKMDSAVFSCYLNCSYCRFLIFGLLFVLF